MGFNFSGLKNKLGKKLIKYHRSFVGRDFKAIAQCGIFIFRRYFTQDEKKTWLALSKVCVLNAM